MVAKVHHTYFLKLPIGRKSRMVNLKKCHDFKVFLLSLRHWKLTKNLQLDEYGTHSTQKQKLFSHENYLLVSVFTFFQGISLPLELSLRLTERTLS